MSDHSFHHPQHSWPPKKRSAEIPAPHGADDSDSRPKGPRPEPMVRWEPWIPGTPRILIVAADDRLAEKLTVVFRHAGLAAERARTMTDGSERARSGRFPVVVTTPQLQDGSWKRLVSIAHNYRPGFAIILVATRFDLNEWALALEDGALDVLDALYELPRAAEVAKRALWTEYLTGAWPNFAIPAPEQAS